MTLQDVRRVVDAPARVPYRFGLFSVISFVPDERAAGGVAWDSLGCLVPGTITDDCIVVGGGDGTMPATNIECADKTVNPFTVVSFDESSLGRPPRSASPGRAQARLIAGEQTAVETELSGYLVTGATDITVAASGLATQLGEMEHALAEQGSEGVIVVRRSVIAAMPDYFMQTGSMLRTKLGTPVAALGGWTPASPLTIFGVPSFIGHRSAVSVGTGWNRAINDVSEYAERDYAIGWDCTALTATAA